MVPHKKMQLGFLEYPSSTFPSTVCLALVCNTTVSLLMTVHASESFNITSCVLGFVSSSLCGVSPPKFLKLLFLAYLVHPGSTLPSRESFWEIGTWVIKLRSSLRFYSSKRASCRDATKPKVEFMPTVKERLP